MPRDNSYVLENLRKNVNEIGNLFLQKKIAENQRRQEIQDSIRKAVIEGKLKLRDNVNLMDNLDLSQVERVNPWDNLHTILGGGQWGQFKVENVTTDEQGNPRLNIKAIPTQEETQRESENKAKEQALVQAEKERQLNISKVSRLSNIASDVEKKFMNTSPYSSETFVGKMGIIPLLGMVDVAKSQLQATEAQRNDRAYISFLKGMRAQLARAMGDVGNLSEPEQKAAMELMPTLLDSKETGLKKLENLRDFIKTIQNTKTFTGQPMNSQNQDDPLGLRR
jgi:hypothetical protein